jgi:hypothetical protein
MHADLDSNEGRQRFMNAALEEWISRPGGRERYDQALALDPHPVLDILPDGKHILIMSRLRLLEAARRTGTPPDHRILRDIQDESLPEGTLFLMMAGPRQDQFSWMRARISDCRKGAPSN